MPIHKYQSTNIELEGPIIEVKVYPFAAYMNSINAANSTTKNVIAPFSIGVGLIDTGASCSCIDYTLVSQLAIAATDSVDVCTPAGMGTQNLYDVLFNIPTLNSDMIPLQVLGCDLTGQPYDLLVGRDVLKKCTFIYNGWDHAYILSK